MWFQLPTSTGKRRISEPSLRIMNRFASLIDGFVTPCLADSRLRGLNIAGMLGGMSDSRLHKLYQLKFQYMVEHIYF